MIPVEVYFDDLKVTQTKSPVVQTDDYYPFGLTFNEYQRENSLLNKYKYNGMEEVQDLVLNWLSPSKYRTYDPMIGRFLQIDPVIKEHESPYDWNTNNPILYPDPTGADSTQRANAIAKASLYVAQNPGDTYPTDADKKALNFKGEPGEKVDCSGLVSKAIIAGGEPDPVLNPGTGNGVQRIRDNTTKVGGKDDYGSVQEGNVVALNNTYDKNDPKKIDSKNDFKHIGMISNIVKDESGKIITMQMIDSSGTPGSGKSGPRVSDIIVNGKLTYWGERINGIYKWDTVPDKPKSK